jgi:hypothetical protein
MSAGDKPVPLTRGIRTYDREIPFYEQVGGKAASKVARSRRHDLSAMDSSGYPIDSHSNDGDTHG